MNKVRGKSAPDLCCAICNKQVRGVNIMSRVHHIPILAV